MLEINFKNVEKLIFYNRKIHQLLPQHTHLFQQWKLMHLLPSLRSSSKKIVLDFLESLDEQNLEILSKHFGMPVTVTKIDQKLVRNYSFDVCEIYLEDMDFYPNIIATRDKDKVYITTWR